MEQLRHSSFIGELVTQRLGYNMPADEDLFRKHYGPNGSYSFWEIYTFGLVSLPGFVHILALTRAEKFDEINMLEMALRQAMIKAYQSDQVFFRGSVNELDGVNYYNQIKKPETIRVMAVTAADWLYCNPWSRHLVPDTLAAFLDAAGNAGARRALPAKIPQAPARPSQTSVNTWMLNLYTEASAAKKLPPKREAEAFPVCAAATGATDAQMRVAMKSIPDNLKRHRGR